jgi:hypothetical protein
LSNLQLRAKRVRSLVLAQSRDQLVCDFAGARDVFRLERNGGNARMAATAELLCQRREILVRGGLIPGIGTERYFGAYRRGAYADGVDAFGV